MSAPERSIPDVDVDGFVALDELVARTRRLSPQDVARVYNVPGLLVDTAPPGGDKATSGERLEASYRRTTDEDSKAPDSVTVLLRYAGRIAFLTKRPGNLFPEMISIGRALNCDIILALGSVSKIHSLIHHEANGSWTYSDQASRNGSFLNGRRLPPGDRFPLKDGDRLVIGLDLACIFLEPTTLFARLRGATR
jgi:hypothetical protein